MEMSIRSFSSLDPNSTCAMLRSQRSRLVFSLDTTYMHSFPEPRPIRAWLLTQVPPLCSPAHDRLVDVLPLYSLILPRCFSLLPYHSLIAFPLPLPTFLLFILINAGRKQPWAHVGPD